MSKQEFQVRYQELRKIRKFKHASLMKVWRQGHSGKK